MQHNTMNLVRTILLPDQTVPVVHKTKINNLLYQTPDTENNILPKHTA